MKTLTEFFGKRSDVRVLNNFENCVINSLKMNRIRGGDGDGGHDMWIADDDDNGQE